MRKSLLAVALAFAFPTAFAQSSVTLYGIVDVGVEYLDIGDLNRDAHGERHFAGFALGPARHGGAGRRVQRRVHARKPVQHRHRQRDQQRLGLLVPSGRIDRDCGVPGRQAGHSAPPVARSGRGRRHERSQQRAAPGDHDRELFRCAVRSPGLRRPGDPVRRHHRRPPVHARLRDHQQVLRVGRPDRAAVRSGIQHAADPRQQRVAVPGRTEGLHPLADVRFRRLRSAPHRAHDAHRPMATTSWAATSSTTRRTGAWAWATTAPTSFRTPRRRPARRRRRQVSSSSTSAAGSASATSRSTPSGTIARTRTRS